jgi:hypothetical protein
VASALSRSFKVRDSLVTFYKESIEKGNILNNKEIATVASTRKPIRSFANTPFNSEMPE